MRGTKGISKGIRGLGVIYAIALALPARADIMWQTTKTTIGGFDNGGCALERGQVRVKVYPAYLDVEEELEISALGTVNPGNDANTLEIVGNFTLPSGAAITGSLLWDGDRILEGKLLDRKTADSLYETMVERNAVPPPRPRDPLILELTAKDTYRIRIYPVRLGNTRRFHLRYQLPPRIGAEGFEMLVQTAAGSLFPQLPTTLPVTMESGGTVRKAIFVEGAGRNTLELPRTRFIKVSDLGPSWNSWNWNGSQSSPTIRILPVDPLHQVMVKTRFEAGTFAGHYLNLYASVDEKIVQALGQRVEVVILWKWHNPGNWIQRYQGWEEFTPSLHQARDQATQLLEFHGALGSPGIKVGLLHDDSKSAPRVFKTASRGQDEYVRASEYLRSLQGSYLEEFVRSLRLTGAGTALPASIQASKDRFLSNLRLVKTLYSPETGVIRHLVMVSAGGDHVVDQQDMNEAFAMEMDSLKVSVAGFAGAGFSQAGFDIWEARRAFAYRGPAVSTPWGEMPGLPAMNLNVIVRNARKAYDFNIPCQGGLGLACGTLSFHGKSDVAWSDSLDWEAFDAAGKLLGKARTAPTLVQQDGDTAIATLWAGSAAPFSEMKELPLGPIYGFVDRWASMLALEKDSLDRQRTAAYGDSGVPRIANKELTDVIPNYQDGAVPGGGGGGGRPTSLAGSLPSESGAWRLERAGDGSLVLRIPGLGHGKIALLEVFDIHGRRIGSWSLRSEFGALRWKGASLAPGGVYFMKVRAGSWTAMKRLVL